MNHLFFISVVFLHSLINQSDYDAMFFFLQNAKLKQIISYFVNQLIFFGRAQTRTSGGDGEVTANNFRSSLSSSKISLVFPLCRWD